MLLVNLPYDNLPCRNVSFYGRQNELERMDLAFCKQDQSVSIGLYGLPGSGKSQLALEFAYRKLEDGTYGAVLWISADTETKLLESLSAVAQGLGIVTGDAHHNHRLQQQALINWLAKTRINGRPLGHRMA